jgi:alpha-L-fucosidase 2
MRKTNTTKHKASRKPGGNMLPALAATIIGFGGVPAAAQPAIPAANANQQAQPGAGPDRVVFLEQPVVGEWRREALPLGNGRMGCTVFGGVGKERIQFNVDSLWTGNDGSGKPDFGNYQNFGDLHIELAGDGPVTGYRRELNLSRAVHRVSYDQAGVGFLRETFCSFPDQVVVSRLTANAKGRYSGSLTLKDGRAAATKAEGKALTFTGTLTNGMEYEARVVVVTEGGSIKPDGDKLVFSGCDGLTVILAAGTSYVMDAAKGWKGPHPHALVSRQAEAAAGKSYVSLLDGHVTDHRALFDRVGIDLGDSGAAVRAMPLDQRIKAVQEGGFDPDLEEIFFHVGRYLLIACSRPGSLPANLQGIWNDNNTPPWNADYHSNINVEMNYWLAEPTNLAECHRPLLDLMAALREPFRRSTRRVFGPDVPGFTVGTGHNLFGYNQETPESPRKSKPGAAWYARHYWEHYQFGGDREFLKAVSYPFMKEVCGFWEHQLKELPDGHLVSPNTFSPEHGPGWEPNKGPAEDGVSHDQQLVWDLFNNTIQAAEVLGVDADYRKTLADKRDRLVGPTIGKWGQLQEWMVDRDDPNDDHRHMSHLFAVHPGEQITLAGTPKFADAARVSLTARRDGRTAWSKAWKISLWARLGDGERAHDMVRKIVGLHHIRSLFSNMGAFKPGDKGINTPFQIDANFGFTAGVAEMLIQSHAGEIQLLPALPKAWANGSVKGLCARGGFTVDIEWKNGEPTRAVIRNVSGATGNCVVRHGECTVELAIPAGESREFAGHGK